MKQERMIRNHRKRGKKEWENKGSTFFRVRAGMMAVIVVAALAGIDIKAEAAALPYSEGNQREAVLGSACVRTTSGYRKLPGWGQDRIGWWFVTDEGEAAYAWQQIDGTWFYFHEDGYMAANEWIDGCWLSGNGACTVGESGNWLRDEKGWWFADQAGWYAVGWQKINGKWYYFNPAGYMQTGWQYIGDEWYFLDYLTGEMADL